eukprot:2722662-Amphidinium_carterae.1
MSSLRSMLSRPMDTPRRRCGMASKQKRELLHPDVCSWRPLQSHVQEHVAYCVVLSFSLCQEMKVTWELAKIFGLGEDVKVSCTAVRVPTLRAHSESIVIETEKPVKPEDVQELLKKCPGVKVVDEPS